MHDPVPLPATSVRYVTNGPQPHLSLIKSKFRRSKEGMMKRMFDENSEIQSKRQPWKFTNPDVSFYLLK